MVQIKETVEKRVFFFKLLLAATPRQVLQGPFLPACSSEISSPRPTMREILTWAFLFFQIEEENPERISLFLLQCFLPKPGRYSTPTKLYWGQPSHSHNIFVHILFSTRQTFAVAFFLSDAVTQEIARKHHEN